MSPSIKRMLDNVPSKSFWCYKDRQYQVVTVAIGMLSQDPKGEWVPTVIYQLVDDKNHDTQITQNARLFNFARALTEFCEKFERC